VTGALLPRFEGANRYEPQTEEEPYGTVCPDPGCRPLRRLGGCVRRAGRGAGRPRGGRADRVRPRRPPRRAGPGGAAAAAARPPGPAGGAGGAGRPRAPPARGRRGGDHAEPAGDRPRQAAGHAVRHGAGYPVRLAPPRGTQPLPGRCRLVPAALPAFPCPGPAGRGRSGARLVRGLARGHRRPLRAGDRQTAGRAGGGERRRRYRRVLCRPRPGAVHRLDAAGHLRRRQRDRDAARGAAPGHRQGRRPPGQDADPADGRGETQPQADGHPGLRLRRRAGSASPARRDRPARRAPRAPHAPAQAQGEG
jgi:hypothetical protein